MPKIAVHGGPTDAGQPGYFEPGRSHHSPNVVDPEPEDQPAAEVEPVPALESAGDDYDSLTYSELQALCRRRTLPAQGSADALIERLREHDKQ